MSVGATAQNNVTPSTKTAGRPNAPGQLRLWPAALLLAAFWLFLYFNYFGYMAQSTRFVSRAMLATLVLLLSFIGWWLSRSAVARRDRFGALGVFVLSLIAISFVTHKSLNLFGLLLIAAPVAFTTWALWLFVSRNMSLSAKRRGFCVITLLSIGFFTLMRSDGLWADQEPTLIWRWIPTSESLFLAGRPATAKQTAPNDVQPWKPQPGDCLEYRGANRDGVLPGVSISTDWESHPPKMLWHKKVGPGWSGMIVVDGHLVTQEQRDKAEAVVCYDAATGEEVWAHEDPVRFEEDLAGPGPRGTPTFADGRIYSFGALGKLNCLKAETGEVVWSHDCVADADVSKSDLPQWGFSVSPLVVDGLVVVFAGGSSGKSVLAYKTSDGELAWKQAGGKQSYSSPQLVTLRGKKQLLMADTSALRALNIADGAQLWEFPSTGAMSLPMLQPHAAGDDSVAFSTEPGVAVLDIKPDGDKWSADARWTSNKLRAGFSDFVLNKGCLFGFDDGKFCCFDLADGKRLWLKGRLGHDQILSLPDQDVFVISTEEGDVVLASADRQGYKELGRFKAIEGKTWNSPVLVAGHLFLRNAAEMAAFDVSPPSATPTN